MIHVNYPNSRKPPEEWLKKAAALTDALMSAENDKAARDKIIENNAALWTELRDWLEEFSYGKCWFTEARGLASYWQVEHFRPKKEAKDPNRDGYWWRAFDYLNYRLAGSVTNSKKGSFFPLKPGTQPAGLHDNCEEEAALLIDPTRKAEVDLITFSDAGMATASVLDGWEHERAMRSIDRYKLNDHVPLRRARQQVWNLCKQKADQLQTLIIERRRAEKAGGKYSKVREEQIERLCSRYGR